MDILKQLLEAYKTDIEAKMSTGELGFCRAVYHDVLPDAITPEFSTPLPCILMYPATVNVQNVCLGAYAYEKNYEITLTLIMESHGEAYGLFGQGSYQGLYECLSDLEGLYHSETFDLTAGCELLREDFTSHRIAPFFHAGILQGHLTVQHKYIDMRGV